ncbi:hypothetical protein CPB83DRAFT_843345 [Crepidotus variabilis]|uniref:Uncharacterized protein n=1 Tax=Crepidotus variabilis TaxID=179855 RepID=A0A9P6EUE9_9AGAR|nr:hypothetical protein CPB83DRAFT_843345 [Crepidotus variabilis]
MSTTNINDPASVVALLEQLKASSAWQELEQSTSSDNQAASSSLNHDTETLGLAYEAQDQDGPTAADTADTSTSSLGVLGPVGRRSLLPRVQ